MKRIILLALLHIMALDAKVLIFTYSYNRPDFIEIQHKTFERFVKEEYEFVVFNDAPDTAMAQSITHMCARYGIQCIRIPQEIHTRPYLHRLPGEYYNDPAVRNCNVVQYSLNEYGFAHDDILVLVDSDLFLVREFNFHECLRDHDIASLMQGIGYLWIGLVILNMKTLPNIKTLNFNCGRVNNTPVDAGGHSYDYIHDNPTVRVKAVSQFYPPNFKPEELTVELFTTYKLDTKAIHFLLENPANIEFLYDGCFFHYRGGTNWDRKSPEFHIRKMTLVNNYIESLLN